MRRVDRARARDSVLSGAGSVGGGKGVHFRSSGENRHASLVPTPAMVDHTGSLKSASNPDVSIFSLLNAAAL